MNYFIKRKNNQGVSIGDVYIKVHLNDDNQVMLEIDAPPGALIIEDDALDNAPLMGDTQSLDEELALLEASLAF